MKRTRSVMRAGAAVVAAFALVLTAACGDDDDDDDGSTTGGGSTSGEPIKIMNWTAVDNPSYNATDTRAGAQARAAAINEAGGIGGRPLELEFCNTNFDPNGEAACARRAIDEGFVAVVGSTSFFPNTFPLLERAGIPYIGGIGTNPNELTSEVSFPLAGAIPGWFQGTAALAVQAGARNVSIVTSPVGSAELAGEQMAVGLRAAGIEPVRKVSAPVGQPDMSAVATEAAEGVDTVLIGAIPSDALKVVQSLRQSGFTGRITSPTTQFPDDTIAALGDGANGILLTSQVVPVTQTDNEAIAAFIEDMNATAPDERKAERAIVSWAAVGLFAELVERMDGEITAATVLDAMSKVDDPIDVGVVAPYRTTGEPTVAEFPRIFNPTVVFTEIRDGKITQTSDGFVNPFQILAEAAGG